MKGNERDFWKVDNIGKYSHMLIHGNQFGSGNGGFPHRGASKTFTRWKSMSGIGNKEFPPFMDMAFEFFATINTIVYAER